MSSAPDPSDTPLEYLDIIYDTDRRNRITPQIGDIEFSLYGPQMQPPVAVDTGARHVEKEPIGEEPVRQYMGPNLDQITIVGECSVYEASQIDQLKENEEVYVRTFRWSGNATVDSTSTESLGKRYNGTWVYKYTIKLTEA